MIGVNRALRKLDGNAHGQRWAFMATLRVPNLDGTPYLTRLRFVQTPWFGIYLHQIHTKDWDRHLHDHPWRFASLVLSGAYCEKVAERPEGTDLGVTREVWRDQGRMHPGQLAVRIVAEGHVRERRAAWRPARSGPQHGRRGADGS